MAHYLPYHTPFGAFVPMATGSLSTISSALIIYVIVKSKTKLTTVYHRIIFSMSCADILGSIAMALTTIPMPTSLPQEIYNLEEDFRNYDWWAGPKLGNTSTCEAQGFFFTFGIIVMYAYNAMLCVYYACAIAFRMKEKNIVKYVEPLLHVFCLFLGLASSVPSLFYKVYNPSGWESWCTISPLGCEWDKDGPEYDECFRGFKDAESLLNLNLALLIIVLVAIIFISLSLVIIKVIQIDKEISDLVAAHQAMYGRQAEIVFGAKKRHENTKVVLKQALAYILAFVLTLTFPIIQLVWKEHISSFWPNYLELVFTPLQGFFNFIIFIGHKVYSCRRVETGRPPICQVLKDLFTGVAEEPMVFSRISLIRFDDQMKSIEIGFDDEMMNEQSLYSSRDDNDYDGDQVPVDNHPSSEEFRVKTDGITEFLSYPHTISGGHASAGNDVFWGDEDISSSSEILSSMAGTSIELSASLSTGRGRYWYVIQKHFSNNDSAAADNEDGANVKEDTRIRAIDAGKVEANDRLF